LKITADGTTGWLAIKRDFAPSSYTFPNHLPFVLYQTIDYPHGRPNGAGGLCFPTSGILTADVGQAGTLVLALQGEACQSYGNATAALLINATYAGHPNSTGLFQDVQAVGSYTTSARRGWRAASRT
jgi:hypothetical protein